VFKAKPDALKEDVDRDLQKSLAAHAELIATDRLLELIDQFAAAEGRMKWVPNKKLHFEVAIIKAIQSLGQATLDEVIEKLGGLRDGKSKTAQTSPVAAGVSPASGKTAAGTAASTATGITDPGYSKSKGESARVAESPSKYKAAEPSADVDPARVWEELSAKIPSQKAFLRNSAAVAHVLGIEGRNFQLGFSPDEKPMMEILGTQANRKFLETLLHEITGKAWTVTLSVKAELPSKQTSASGKGSRPEDFKNDPLIQEALEMFKGEIKS
jgi:DNA polymerase-3 subunit gamma/tau